MKTTVTGFHQDEEAYWVADLACGHSRHFRHNPPWQNREWVTTPEGRDQFLGFELDCKECDPPTTPPDVFKLPTTPIMLDESLLQIG